MKARKAKSAKRRSAAQPPQGRAVLVIDDEPGTVEVLTTVLKEAGIDAIGAGNGREGLAKLRVSMVGLVLLDVMMPVLDGPETLRALRADRTFARLPVVLMSGIPESMVKRRCRGYTAFLRKPFSLDELLATVERAMESP